MLPGKMLTVLQNISMGWPVKYIKLKIKERYYNVKSILLNILKSRIITTNETVFQVHTTLLVQHKFRCFKISKQCLKIFC